MQFDETFSRLTDECLNELFPDGTEYFIGKYKPYRRKNYRLVEEEKIEEKNHEINPQENFEKKLIEPIEF